MNQCYINVGIFRKPEISLDTVLSTSIHCIVESSIANKCINAIDKEDIIDILNECRYWHPSINEFYVHVSANEIGTGKNVGSRWISA